MLRTIRVLVGQEIAKTIRSRFSYFGPIAAVLVCVRPQQRWAEERSGYPELHQLRP